MYQCNLIITETSKNALSKDICTVPRVEQSVSAPLITGFETQSFVCLIANTPLWQKRREVRKEGCPSEHCKSNAPAPLVAQEE